MRPLSSPFLSPRTAAFTFSLLLAAACAHAQDPGSEIPLRSSTALPLWEVGAGLGLVSQQAYPGADQQVRRALVLPYAIYRGEYLRSEGSGLQLRGYKSEALELSLSLSGSLGSNSNNITARQGMPNLGTLVELGPRVRWNVATLEGGARIRADLPLRGVLDLSNGLASRGLAFEPQISYADRTGPALGSVGYSASASAIYADRKLADHFYGVAPAYANAARPAYAATSGLVATRLALGLSKPLGTDWRVYGYARLDSVAGAANAASPLVKQRAGGSVGVGLSYSLFKSESRGGE